MFQKQSPFLDEVNNFIDLAKGMGLIHMSFYNHLPNATKCNTISDVFRSYAERNHKVIVEINDIYGIMILLGIGVAGAVIIFSAEIASFVKKGRKDEDRQPRQQHITRRGELKSEDIIWPIEVK